MYSIVEVDNPFHIMYAGTRVKLLPVCLSHKEVHEAA